MPYLREKRVSRASRSAGLREVRLELGLEDLVVGQLLTFYASVSTPMTV